MARLLAFCLPLLLVAPAAVAAPLNDAEAAAMAKYRDCIQRQIVQQDDGTSEARRVGNAVMKSCAAEMDAMAAAAGEGDTEAKREAFRTKFESSVADTVAGFVVMWRTTQRRVREEAAAK